MSYIEEHRKGFEKGLSQPQVYQRRKLMLSVYEDATCIVD